MLIPLAPLSCFWTASVKDLPTSPRPAGSLVPRANARSISVQLAACAAGGDCMP
ncbi:Uncharacterised protein [Mycobacteroides abscessus subsp. abscessus]|nr:Uncharacterised protein [Mycobacteroides abscessus subsp. abscessus]SKS59176.1 Uncharacterised protein [Mycobacteroides abscessus subsp. abscessus]